MRAVYEGIVSPRFASIPNALPACMIPSSLAYQPLGTLLLENLSTGGRGKALPVGVVVVVDASASFTSGVEFALVPSSFSVDNFFFPRFSFHHLRFRSRSASESKRSLYLA